MRFSTGFVDAQKRDAGPCFVMSFVCRFPLLDASSATFCAAADAQLPSSAVPADVDVDADNNGAAAAANDGKVDAAAAADDGIADATAGGGGGGENDDDGGCDGGGRDGGVVEDVAQLTHEFRFSRFAI